MRCRPPGNPPNRVVRRNSVQTACSSTGRNDCRSRSGNSRRSRRGNCRRSRRGNCYRNRRENCQRSSSYRSRWFCGLEHLFRRCWSRLLLQCRGNRNCWNLSGGRTSFRLCWLPRWSHSRRLNCCKHHWSLRPCHERYRRSVFLLRRARHLALHKNREYAGRVLDRGCSAEIRRAHPIAANQIHTEAVPARVGLAEWLIGDPDLEPGKICQLLGQMRLTVRVGKQFRAIELAVQIVPVIAGKQNQMRMSERLAVLPAKNTNRDGLVVDYRKNLRSAA